MQSMFRLVLRSGPIPDKAFPLEKAEVFIGRDLGNDIVINDAEVSRRHSRLYLQGNNYVIEDLGSTNGTSVSGVRLVGPYILRPGEMVTLGERVKLSYEAVQPLPDSTLTGPPAYAQSAQPAQVAPVGGPFYDPGVPQQPEGQGFAFKEEPYIPQAPSYQAAPPPPPVEQPVWQEPMMQPQQPMYTPQPQMMEQPQMPVYTGPIPDSMPQQPVIQYRIPVWIWIVLGVLVVLLIVLAIDDFHLWTVFGL